MNQLPTQCQNLSVPVEQLIQLLQQEPSLRSYSGSQSDTLVSGVRASLRQAISPEFEIAFAGPFSAGKSMLINALLQRQLLYSGEGHATGTECRIYKAKAPDQEEAVLTLLSTAEIKAQVDELCKLLQNGLPHNANIASPAVVNNIKERAKVIIQEQGGEGKTETAKHAKVLILLLEGFETNQANIQPTQNSNRTTSLKEAAEYARRGSNSAILKRIDYYCDHPLLEGNVLVDLPGIDAPVKKDAQLAFDKVADDKTAAVVCVLATASNGEITEPETQLIEAIRKNPGIRNRVFWVFNRIDETWYNDDRRLKFEETASQFYSEQRVYKTSGLLGFYGYLVQTQTDETNNFGLSINSIFGDYLIEGKTPQFVESFIDYLKVYSRRNPAKIFQFQGKPEGNYVRILSSPDGHRVLEELIHDSQINEFREAINRYLIQEKRPQLFEALATDLRPLCETLRRCYLERSRYIKSQPEEIDALKNSIKEAESKTIVEEIAQIVTNFKSHISQEEVPKLLREHCQSFEADFTLLQNTVETKMKQILENFSAKDIRSLTLQSDDEYTVDPLASIVSGALRYLADELNKSLAPQVRWVVDNFFNYLVNSIYSKDYYNKLCRLAGDEAGIQIEQDLKNLQAQVQHALENYISIECDRYRMESYRFYGFEAKLFASAENSAKDDSINQLFGKILNKMQGQGFELPEITDEEQKLRQLLQSDFEPKIKQLVRQYIRQAINLTLKRHLLRLVNEPGEFLLKQYTRAVEHLEQKIEKTAQEKLASNQQIRSEIQRNIATYNKAVAVINECLGIMLPPSSLLLEFH